MLKLLLDTVIAELLKPLGPSGKQVIGNIEDLQIWSTALQLLEICYSHCQAIKCNTI